MKDFTIRKFYLAIFVSISFIASSFTYTFAKTSSQTQLEAKQRQTFVATAKSYLGTPYKYGGLSKKGIDCSGLIFNSARKSLGKNLPRTSQALAKYSQKVSLKQIKPGDLMFFKTSVKISHVGIYIGKGNFIHSTTHAGVIVSNIKEKYWKNSYRFSGKVIGRKK